MSKKFFQTRTARKLAILSLILLASVFLSACTIEQMQERDLNRSSLWGSLVGFLSDFIDSVAVFAGSYGLAIIIVTIIIRIITMPLMMKQLKGMKAMQVIQPELQALQEKWKDNKEKLNEETMKLFQKHNVNPLAGCLPLLVQMPILIAFYQAIMYNKEIREASFLYLQLGSKDPFFILPVLAAATTYLQQKTTPQQGDNPQMKMMLTMMPLMILVVSMQLPSALALYWVIGNIFSIGQNFVIHREAFVATSVDAGIGPAEDKGQKTGKAKGAKK